MASFPVNASFGKRDNKVALQAIKHLLSEVDVRQKQHVGSPWRHAEDSPLTTMLDRIQVISVKDGKRTAIWFRLIGPGRSLNLELAAPQSSLYRSVMRISMKPIPELYRDLIEVEARTRCCFGDLYDFIKQYGFHRWTFPQQCSGQTADECLSWACSTIACLTHRDTFGLRMTVSGGDPLACLVSHSTIRLKSWERANRDENRNGVLKGHLCWWT